MKFNTGEIGDFLHDFFRINQEFESPKFGLNGTHLYGLFELEKQ